MTTIEEQALALWNEVRVDKGLSRISDEYTAQDSCFTALCRAIERHEADKAAWQAERHEVSEAARDIVAKYTNTHDPAFYLNDMYLANALSRFIIAPPVDPLVEALETFSGMPNSAWGSNTRIEQDNRAKALRAALAKHGLAITGVE